MRIDRRSNSLRPCTEHFKHRMCIKQLPQLSISPEELGLRLQQALLVRYGSLKKTAICSSCLSFPVKATSLSALENASLSCGECTLTRDSALLQLTSKDISSICLRFYQDGFNPPAPLTPCPSLLTPPNSFGYDHARCQETERLSNEAENRTHALKASIENISAAAAAAEAAAAAINAASQDASQASAKACPRSKTEAENAKGGGSGRGNNDINGSSSGPSDRVERGYMRK